MAKRFGGFTPQQQQTLLSKMGYTGPAQQDDINKFMMSSPKASSMMGKYAQMAKARVSGGPRTAMQAGGMAKGFNQGGSSVANALNAFKTPFTYDADTFESTYTTSDPSSVNTTSAGDIVGGASGPSFVKGNGLGAMPAEQMATQVTPEQMAAQEQAQAQANAAQQQSNSAQAEGLMQGPEPTEQQLAMRDANNAFMQSPVIMAAQEAKKAIEKQAMQQAGLSGPPTNQEEQDRFIAAASPLMENSPEMQAARKAQEEQNAKMQQQYGQGDAVGPAETAPALPTSVDVDSTVTSLIEANPQDYYVNEIDYEKNKKFAVDQTKALSGNTAIMANPDDYKIEMRGNRYHIVYPDGTTINTEYAGIANAEARAKGVAAGLKAVKPLQDTYNQQLDQYKQYQSGQAGAGLDDTRAELDTSQRNLAQEQNLLRQYSSQLANMDADDPQRSVMEGLVEQQQVKTTNAKANLSQAQTNVESVGMPSTTELRATALEDPESLVTKADVVTVSDAQREAGKIAEGTGQAATTAEQATVTTADTATDVVAPEAKAAATYDATTIEDRAKAELERAKAATDAGLSAESTFLGEQGTVSADALASEVNTVAENRINKVNENVNLEVTKQQLAEAKGNNLKAIETNIAQSEALREAVAATSQVQPEELPAAALIAEDQMAQAKAITDAGLSPEANPVAAKMAKFSVDNGTLALAMEGEVKALATVEGQLSQLMKDFDDGTPAWAAGAMRAANAVMASRGLGASSMASAAILQAAMESALPIAQQDANTFAQMGLTNLKNSQQVALSNAAAQQGLSLQNLNNEQQANLQRSAQAFSLQETNLSNRQSAEIANAQIRATLQGQNLSNQQQSNIAVAARYAEQANINLNNKQQASMQTNANQLQTNLANLSTKSQAYVTNANLAASLQGQVLSNEQQTSIQNAARYSDAANITFTAQQQNALHNSKMMQTIGLAELDANMAATLQNAATYAGMDMANLNNRQQAAAQNAKAFLELDMTNLNNEQQMAMFKAQATQQALLSDQAAENAAKQFNAASENQTNQFYDNLTTQVALHNQEQTNAMNRFNAGEENAIEQFNAAQQNARDQFNASNALVVEQANAQWEQAITTMDNAAQNTANRDAAIVANNLSETTYNNMLQQERDAMDYAWRSAESALTRENNLVLQGMQTDSAASTAKGNAAGSIAAVATNYLLQKTFGAI